MDKIICLGKNYSEHVREMGEPSPEMPVLFLKPPSSLLSVPSKGETVQARLPKNRGAIHHECEIVLKIGSQSKIESVTLGLDLTLRDEQSMLKKKGHPWEVSKVFLNSAIVGPWIAIEKFSNYLDTEFQFQLDGEIRQKGCGNQMRLLPVDALQYISKYFPLCPGDAIFTGTPAGVGPLLAGQKGELIWGTDLLYRVEFL